MDDRHVLERIQAGDETAFAELHREYRRLVLSRIRRVTVSADLADEVAQEFWLYLWKNASSITLPQTKLAGWLATVAHRRAVDCVRNVEASRKRDEAYALRHSVNIDDSPEEYVGITWNRPLLGAALAQLTERQRAVVGLRHFAGLSHPQIAEILAIPVGTSKTRYRDGILRLRTLLAETSPGPAPRDGHPLAAANDVCAG